MFAGHQSDFDFDTVAELIFASQQAFEAFTAKFYSPDTAAQISADEAKFLDLGDVNETTKVQLATVFSYPNNLFGSTNYYTNCYRLESFLYVIRYYVLFNFYKRTNHKTTGRFGKVYIR